MDKYIYIFVIIFALMIPLVLFFILKPMLKHNKLLNGIVNYDTYMEKYVFSITLKKEDFYAQLRMPNDEGWLTHLSAGVLSQLEISSGRPPSSYKKSEGC